MSLGVMSGHRSELSVEFHLEKLAFNLATEVQPIMITILPFFSTYVSSLRLFETAGATNFIENSPLQIPLSSQKLICGLRHKNSLVEGISFNLYYNFSGWKIVITNFWGNGRIFDANLEPTLYLFESKLSQSSYFSAKKYPQKVSLELKNSCSCVKSYRKCSLCVHNTQ